MNIKLFVDTEDELWDGCSTFLGLQMWELI